MEKAKLLFMGTGTSQGVPIIGCRCDVCKSKDPRDKRLRSSAYVEYGGLGILVDAGPDFRFQMLRAGIGHLDAILLTHNHRDHTGGLDDVRALNYIEQRPAEIYCEEHVLDTLKFEYPYVFEKEKYPGAPEWHMHLIENKPFMVLPNDSDNKLVWINDRGYCIQYPDGSLKSTDAKKLDKAILVDDPGFSGDSVSPSGKGKEIIPIRGFHDKMPVLGFRFGNIAYITDMSMIPDEEFAKLQNLDHVTINTVGYKHHHSHFSLDEAIAVAHKINAKHTWLTHLSHVFPVYDEFCSKLRELSPDLEILPAYDGLIIE
ncbi:MAG: MBL fold metallo-hydrolase [Bacteroidales bacterium]|jgi:phosphoribosyl 1,2-cyclic phosphate phosphodiesterase|nr:MBL fold metallo-hydrolase [Bacteroidales bacterium]MCI1785921.1 MBL fold metallo-hydrolase [Bacteroidales bacterium]